MGRRKALKALTEPIRLQKILDHLHATPKLTLVGLRSLKLSYAYRNDHFGARHFVKEELPRIRYANPLLKIEVDKAPKLREEQWRPEMELEFDNGTSKTIDMNSKWSTRILKELMELAGGDPWRKWQRTAERQGLPLAPGEEKEAEIPAPIPGMLPLPNLKAYREAHPPEEREKRLKDWKEQKAKEKAERKRLSDLASTTSKRTTKKNTTATSVPPPEEVILPNLHTKTGAAAILP
ncbi:hypothetical protein Moror_12635 [Moniliophthora roreri MCA 2997]|uniref:Ribosomal protein/NADH dehydrogenase domain-containing protein n=1 Tax=Moniliophthora roreri (strain MCA 2997) TaxID=1381753 RepID=V2XRR4_MONRO|nr:hypothetical protein Moror_12635 [Moniliophthora roreri MCA 2997]